MTSPYASASAMLIEQGLSVVPCGPGTKFPGRHGPDGWHVAHDWQRFCDRLPSSRFEVPLWETWPDAGICLALGRASAPAGLQLLALDIDTDEPAIVAAIDAVLPGSPVRKRGAKGETRFYLAPADVPNRPYNDGNRQRLLDLLGHGRQTVLPPTVHPDTGQPYRWTTLDTLENFDVADLPVLPADIADRLSDALKPFGHVDAPTIQAGQADPDAAVSTHRELNNAALANLGAWVPALNLYKCREVGGKYKAVAHWRPSSSGRPSSKRATNLALSSEGIKDCGDGKGYTPLNLVMAACGADLDSAFRWLQERVAPAKAVVFGAKAEVEEQDQEEASAHVPSAEEEANMLPTPSQGTVVPPELCTPPGLIGDLVQWIIQSDDSPSPQLALAATISFFGALAGRRYAHPIKSGRTNFYCLGVAKTGFGKNHALVALVEVARASGLLTFLGPARFKSDAGIRKALERAPSICCFFDEMGGWLRTVLGRRAASHEAAQRDLVLDLFSKANTTFMGSEGATEEAQRIDNPNLCIYGASTPYDVWSNLTSGAALDGFLPRWLVFDAGERTPEFSPSDFDLTDPPQALCKALHKWFDAGRSGGNLAAIGMGKPRVAGWGDGAKERVTSLTKAKKHEAYQAEAAGRRTESAILTRYAEHVNKLCLLVAVSRDAVQPIITVVDIEWAEAIAACSCQVLISALEGKIADSDTQAEYLLVSGMIHGAGSVGIGHQALINQLNGRLRRSRREEIIADLKAGMKVQEGILPVRGRGRPAHGFLWVNASDGAGS